MEIIDELEPEARGPYAGAVGYLSYSGDLDTCITIRTLVVQGEETSVTAGAGIVADSDPASEERETESKAAALLAAAGLAEAIDRGERGAPRDPRGRQLRLLHLQPRADAGGGRGGGRGAAQRRRERRGHAGAPAARASCCRPAPGRPEDGRRLRRAAPPAAPRCRCSASASATRRWAWLSAPRSIARRALMHGKTSPVRHGGRALRRPAEPVRGDPLPQPGGARGDAAAGARGRWPGARTARSWGCRHRELPYCGVQFHPESVLTGAGARLLRNFLDVCGGRWTASVIDPRQALGRLAAGESLTREETEELFGAAHGRRLTDALKAALLVALRMKGEAAAEIAGAAAAMRRRVIAIPHRRAGVVDTCGTGGDGRGTFNISTAAALVAAAAGVPVAKHGNRSVSSRCGSADVLAALGGEGRDRRRGGGARARRGRHRLPLRAAAPPRHARGHAGAPRAGPADDLQRARAAHQPGRRAGARSWASTPPSWCERSRGCCADLGAEHALVVHGADGLDEITTTGPTLGRRGAGRRGRRATPWSRSDLGVPRAALADLAGGGPEENAALMRRLLRRRARDRSLT